MKNIKCFIVGLFISLIILFISCTKNNSSITSFKGIYYLNNKINLKNIIPKTATVSCEDLSDNMVLKKKYIINGFIVGERIYIIWKRRSDKIVFIETNNNRLYYLEQKENCIGVFAKSFIRYYFDSSRIGKTWATYEDTWSKDFFSNEYSSTSLTKINITLLDINYLYNDTLYFFKHQFDGDDESSEYYLIDQNLNLHEFRTQYKDFDIRFTPEE